MNPPDPTPLFDMSVAFWRSGALFAALELNLFNTLSNEAKSAESLAAELNVPLRTLDMLLEALAALDLVESEDGTYRNAPLATTFLTAASPAYLGDTILFNARAWNAWGALSTSVRDNTPGVPPETFLGKDPAATQEFVMGMHHRALGVARCMLSLIDLGNVSTLLDIGGGPATYARLLAERYESLQVTVLDVPAVIDVAATLIADSTARDRITLQPGSMFTDSFGSDFDAVLFSGVLHRTEGDDTVKLLQKAADALKPRGQVFISDVFTGSDNQGPVLPELFSLQMMLISDQGRSLKLPEIAELCQAAGLELQSKVPYPPPLPHTLCVAVKL